jgi:hypothetical protein
MTRFSPKFCLLAALLTSVAALPAHAETISLRCTITPDSKQPAYNGYVWIDAQPRRAFERWYPPGYRSPPPIEGPFHVDITPNELTIADSASPHGKERIRIDRTSGSGSVTGGRILCDGAGVSPPPFPPPPAQKH